MRCPSCSNDIPDGISFCGTCGAHVTPTAPLFPASPSTPLWSSSPSSSSSSSSSSNDLAPDAPTELGVPAFTPPDPAPNRPWSPAPSSSASAASSFDPSSQPSSSQPSSSDPAPFSALSVHASNRSTAVPLAAQAAPQSFVPWLVVGMVQVMLCGNLLGIAPVVFAILANQAWNRGDADGFAKHLNTARITAFVTLGLTFVGWAACAVAGALSA